MRLSQIANDMLRKTLQDRYLKWLLLGIVQCFMLLNFISPAWAVTIQAVPNPRHIYGGWVSDMANLLPPEIEVLLNEQISALEAKNGIEIAIVTVPDTAPSETAKQFATQLFKFWGIGKKHLNNGVLFLISERDRRIEIETGYGIEPILPDLEVGKIVQTKIIPFFKRNDFAGGTVAGTQAIVTTLSMPPKGENPDVRAQPSTSGSSDLQWVWIPIYLIAVGTYAVWAAIGKRVKTLFPTAIAPAGVSRIDVQNDEAIACAVCKQPMQKLDRDLVLSSLQAPQKIAQELGSIRVDGWQCPTCRPQLTGLGFHLRTHVVNDYSFHLCPTCRELTVSKTFQELAPATKSETGKRLAIAKCACCEYSEELEEIVPMLSDSSTFDPICSDSGDGGGGGSGGGDFGGGDSGGGGDGGSW
ncbi:TPM domain-containing protein [Tumidithrix elongata RA019]|uniref:TPM domain-containing protein n=1 Tax=Tumidithrix elongata BACA0141 TaxID=2716417 RepID=A0AAW9Q152_9CYAN|nr:TPM domain-containing protein [Tumidithrix elongata RA019]